MRAMHLPASKAILSSGFLLFGWLLSSGAEVPSTASPDADAHRVYSHLLDPREHPDYERRAVRPPSWETFKNRTQFTCLRGFEVKDDQISGYTQELEKFTRTHELGNVIWPSYPILFAKNLGDLADEIRRRDLYLFDVWGYVPGSGPGGYWQQFKAPPEALAVLEARLGERWLGTDIGEQDGRYVGGYADQMTPSSAGRFEQYLNFQRHFERMGDDLGHKHATLVSLNFGHYLLKEGTYTLIGAETAQALPNNQVYYAFIRGAGKQYGVPWFGNASIFNRWGFKTYGSAGRSDGYEHGPTKGTSLSLMKRLLYSHIFYNGVAVGFENGWFDGDQLSPIGRIQQSAQRWILENGQPGVMHTPIALLLDFNAGWTFPRHLYSDKVYRVWGNLPYDSGDLLTDALLDLLYPGYQDSSFFHDESGFMTPTPYGDMADCLLSDAPGWLLARYPVIVLAGTLSGGREVRDKLQSYVEQGGHLILTAGQLGRLPHGLGELTDVKTNTTVRCGKGTLTVVADQDGITAVNGAGAAIRSEVDRPLPILCALTPTLRQTLQDVLRRQMLFGVGSPELSVITCRKGPGDYRLYVANNSWRELPLEIVSYCGIVQSIRELLLDTSEKEAVGYLPESVNLKQLGHSTGKSIAGGDVRVFAVQVQENIVEIPHRVPPPRPKGRALPLRHVDSLKEAILARPTFFEHFDGVALDWKYLGEREKASLEREAGWIRRQGLRIYIDLSSGVNLYPGLRLIDNVEEDFAASLRAMTNVLEKMQVLGARDLVLSFHRHPENNFTGEQTQVAFEKTLKFLAEVAAAHDVTLHLRLSPGKPPWNLREASQMLDRVGSANLRLAVNPIFQSELARSGDVAQPLLAKLGLWLVAGQRSDLAGTRWDAHTPIHESLTAEEMGRRLALSPGTPIVLDALYRDESEEYLDSIALEKIR